MTYREFKYQHLDRAVERLQMVLNQLRTVVSSARKPVSVEQVDGMFHIDVEGQAMFAPWIQRWRYYRWGFDVRLDTVCRRYGLHDLYPRGEEEWVVDVGAYMGEWALYMLHKGFNVLAIEPDPNAAHCLTKNLIHHGPHGTNWLLDTRVCHSYHGHVTYYLEPHSADSSIFPSIDRPSKPITLTAARLDDIVAERIGGKSIRALKMDAEGAEPEVLAGAPKLLGECPRVSIDAGWERQGESTIAECRRILDDAGFNLVANESFGLSPDIVAGWRHTDNPCVFLDRIP